MVQVRLLNSKPARFLLKALFKVVHRSLGLALPSPRAVQLLPPCHPNTVSLPPIMAQWNLSEAKGLDSSLRRSVAYSRKCPTDIRNPQCRHATSEVSSPSFFQIPCHRCREATEHLVRPPEQRRLIKAGYDREYVKVGSGTSSKELRASPSDSRGHNDK